VTKPVRLTRASFGFGRPLEAPRTGGPLKSALFRAFGAASAAAGSPARWRWSQRSASGRGSRSPSAQAITMRPELNSDRVLADLDP
jgi:hypothetical protein